jgi:predicted transcriptional regulator
MKTQPRLKKGVRESLPSCVIEDIKRAVERDARRWDCSRSWIIATALAAFYDIDIMAPYEVKKKLKRVS